VTPEEIPNWLPLLKRQFLFADLAEDELTRVAAKLDPLSLPRGAVLFQQGDPGDAFYLIASGEVRLLVQKGLSEKVTGYLTRGDSLGEMSLLTGEPRGFTARLETTSEFLVLSKKAFDELVRESPNFLLHVSRLLYRRIATTAQAEEAAASLAPRIVAVVSAVPPEDRTLFLIQLSLGLLDQTRRRVLLVELLPETGAISRAMGLRPTRLSEEMLKGQDLREPSLLNRIGTAHPSGLEILSVPPPVLAGRLFRSIFLLTNLMRENYDFVVIALDRQIGEVESAVLAEADLWMVLASAEQRSDVEVVQVRLRTMSSPRPFETVWLTRDEAEDPAHKAPPEQRVWWPAELVQDFVRTGSPYDCFESRPRALAELGRLARRLARLRVGLAMGAGSALGYALIGILKVLEREHVPVDVLAGSSMGALVGAFYAAGFSALDIEREALKIDKAAVYETIFWDLAVPRSGLLSGTSLLRFFRSYLGYKEFADLRIPFSCTATDIETGEEVVLSKGHIVEAIRASISIPIVFQPFLYNGRYLVDGGLVHPVPTTVLSRMGADILVSVNLMLPAGERKPLHDSADAAERLTSLLPLKGPHLGEIFFKMINTMQYQIARGQTDIAHVTIEPEVRTFSSAEFHRAKELIEEGERACEAALPKLRTYLPFFANYCQYPIKRP
jgi:NTE family protein